MNCQSCSANIDYRFLTHCESCGTEHTSLVSVGRVPCAESVEERPSWTRQLTNLAYIFVSSLAAMISGAVVLYFGAAITCIAFLSNSGLTSGEQCARGTAIGVLSILLGGFLGTVGGCVFALKNPLCKASK